MRLKTRPLTPQEAAILKMIQDGYGPQNTEADVFFTPADEAAVFVKARDGTRPLMVVLTTLYDIGHVLILGRVTSGRGGTLVLQGAVKVLETEFPELSKRMTLHLPDETGGDLHIVVDGL